MLKRSSKISHLLMLVFACFGFFSRNASIAQQITIPRVEMMPNQPAPYHMRNWKRVALGFDSLAFDFNAGGLYLPVIWWRTNTINYPSHNSFGIHSYVGTNAPHSGEAITVLPAVIGASLAGIDKSNQNGENWVLMCEEYFNRRPSENVYLNGPVSTSGNDWWYDTMPNVFFYQLYDMYPNTGDFAYQFTSVADRWLEAIRHMGGSTTPWQVPYMNYRAWYLASMTPNTNGVPEPEAAGALGWILYHAFRETGNQAYRIGAEWSMEFLNNWISNPAYELQLPYGAYIAARMNAELGTQYNVEKIVNWCFDVGSLRNWGVIVGNWGGYDCSGLVGEALGNGNYAFFMNGVEQVGALVPLVRYDDRFARAIGKWVLNVANASRLLYSNFLPDDHQDNAAWTHQYDPRSSFAYEAMRRTWNGLSPYATGDAMNGGWAQTNLGLYGSSHVGIMGGIIDTTTVEKILRLDLLKTDYFHDAAYPGYLYFNPYPVVKTIAIDVGSGQHDIYDAVSNAFLATDVTGTINIDLPADGAVVAVIVPASGTISYRLDQMLINGVVVDYRSGQVVPNYPPRIKSLAASPVPVVTGENTTLYCTAEDRDNNPLTFTWTATAGSITGSGSAVTWTAPATPGIFQVSCMVDDGNAASDTAQVDVEVVAAINHQPAIRKLKAVPRKIDRGATSQLTCSASDPDGDTLTYIWHSAFGTLTASDSTATWTAPGTAGNYSIYCRVEDGHGGQTTDSVGIEVRDFSTHQTGQLIAYYPFSGNANDQSGNGHNGTVYGAVLAGDPFGNSHSAYYFDGINDYIRVPNQTSLNFQQGITVTFWMEIGQFFSRESFPLSHGSWENRWKVSLIPNQHLRWTVKTSDGIKDLDTEMPLTAGVWYHVTVFYDGADFEIYLNGELDNFSSFSGTILPTTIDMTFGQRLPNDNAYNFKGILDDIRIYNYGLSVQEIQNIYTTGIKFHHTSPGEFPEQFVLYQNYPNPFNPTTTIAFSLPGRSDVSLKIFDLSGKEVETLLKKQLPAGRYSVDWDASRFASGIYFCRLKSAQNVSVRKLLLIH